MVDQVLLKKDKRDANLDAFKGHLKEKVKTLRRGNTSFTLKPDFNLQV
jgi:hypothetical protein